MKFEAGRSGNPKGRPKGVADRRSSLRELLSPHAGALIEKAVALALEGDVGALRICLDRIVPVLKARNSPISIGTLPENLDEQGRSVIEAITNGRLTPDEGAAVMSALHVQARIVEISGLERRLAALEKKSP